MSTPRLTRRQAAIIGCYTGVLCGPFGDVHGLAQELLGRPLMTAEFAEDDLWEELHRKVSPDFLKICHKICHDPTEAAK